jgi:hypothetical protein
MPLIASRARRFMSRVTSGWAPWATRPLVSRLSRPQLASFRTFSTNRTSLKLHGPSAQFHFTEQMMDSTSVDRERLSHGRINALTEIQPLILTLIRVADGFAATNWSVTLATLILISTLFVGELLNCVLGLFPSQPTTREKGALTGSLSSPLTMQNVSLQSCPSR